MEKNEHQSRKWAIDIDRENNLEETLEPASNCCIYRIPQFLRHINEEAYTPKSISMGPLHYSRKELMGMEKQKRRYWMKFGERVSEQKLEEFEAYIKNQEEHIRSSKLQSSKYVSIILRDAVFIIELFVRNCESYPKDFLLDKSQLRTYITLDLILLENQLPYFVLNDLYSSAFPSTSSNPSFFTICLEFFSPMRMFNWSLSEGQVKHFTDLLRCTMVMEVQAGNQSYGEISDLPCATKLKESGLKFKGINGKYLLDIKLVKRRKWLPWLKVSEVQIPHY